MHLPRIRLRNFDRHVSPDSLQHGVARRTMLSIDGPELLKMRMRSVTLLALSLLLAGVWSQDCARGQTAPPVSLAPPKASPPRANAKNSPAASDRISPTPPTGGLPQAPNSAADYDGFSVGRDDNDIPDRMTRPMTSRAAKSSTPNPDTQGNTAQQLIDQEDEALKRKLMICRNCK
ncbi:hypothetical protein [Bradyrhizobium ottawaense]|uniref:hypothetical protein n=1 Tax=Bradyrhizobium ottawaense TaxID=931866 RepID=UPI003FA15398